MTHATDKAEADIKATPEYRKFKALLRKVVKAPPLPRKWHDRESPRAGNPNAAGRKSKPKDTE